MLVIGLDLQNLEKIRNFFAQAPELVTKELKDAHYKSSLLVEREAKKETPVDEGILRSSIRTVFRQFGFTVQPHSKYALPVHEGSKPHWPPIKQFTGKEESLDRWIRHKGMPEDAAYPIAAKIAAKGTKGNPFMTRAAETAKPRVLRYFGQAVDNILRAA